MKNETHINIFFSEENEDKTFLQAIFIVGLSYFVEKLIVKTIKSFQTAVNSSYNQREDSCSSLPPPLLCSPSFPLYPSHTSFMMNVILQRTSTKHGTMHHFAQLNKSHIHHPGTRLTSSIMLDDDII